MKKILFHSLTIPPDKVSTGMLVAEIASGFKDRGVVVEILASTPQYNFDSNIDNKVELKKISNAEMINVIGKEITNYQNKKFSKNEFFFDYLKETIKDKRKMGHLTILKD